MVVFLCQRVVVIIVYAQVVGCGIGLLPSFGQALASCLASFLACGSVLLLVVLELQPPLIEDDGHGKVGFLIGYLTLVRAGAFDFITKPWDNGVLLDRIETALKLSSMPNFQAKGNGVMTSTARNTKSEKGRYGIIGNSPYLMNVLETVARVAPTNAPVLITGESGTGKELIAEAIHKQSRRASGPFVKVNLGGISTSLFESEMFGHKKGSFTDATADRIGRFELAKGGTIFLDEIGELSLASQVKLLRVLQDQTYEVLGDSRTRTADVRVICATNADLRAMVEEHTFREDLFYRINLINLHLPPLRERRDDIPLLVEHFLSEACASNGIMSTTVSAEAIAYLQTLPFTGNIRELKNLVERALLMKNPEKTSKHLPLHL